MVNVTRGDTAPADTAERWLSWPVYWSAVWVGTLTAIAMRLIIGLVGIAVWAHVSDPSQPWVDLRKLSTLALIFSVVGAFLAFAAGGWIAGKVAGFFFFQAEDGIRDVAVTGVQTCALPI